MSDEVMVQEAIKILRLAGDESTKILVPAAVRAALAGAQNLRKLILGRIKTLPSDPTAAVARILKTVGSDAEFRRLLYADMAKVRPRSLDVIVPEGPPEFKDRCEALRILGKPGRWMVTGWEQHGKTSLAQQVRHERATEYDASVYINCAAFRTDGTLRYSEIFAYVLHEIGVEVVETNDAALSIQYEAVLLQGRFLLVFDNVDSLSEAEVLVRTWPESSVLVTTRDGSGELGAWCPTEPVELRGMDEAGGRALFEAFAGKELLAAEPEATKLLLALCDCIPGFVRRAGHVVRCRRGERRPVARLVAELRAGHEVNGFEGVLTSLSLQTLPELIYADLTLRSAHPGEYFTRDSAEALLGRPAGATIDTLVSVGLVVLDPDQGFRILRLVRQRVAAAPVEVNAALRRLLEVISESAMTADMAVEKDRLRPAVLPASLTWRSAELTPLEFLDVHASLIVDLVRLAHHQQLHQHAVRLCGALEAVLTSRGRHHLIATAITWGILSAKVLNDATAIARLYGTRARIETELRLYAEAKATLVTAQLVARRADNPRLDASLCEFWSRLEREYAQYAIDRGTRDTPEIWAKAIDWIRRALEIDRAHDSLFRGRGIHARELGNLLVRIGHPEEALLCFEEAALHTDVDSLRNVSRIHLGQARAFDALGRWVDVDREFAQAQALVAASGATTYEIELADFWADTCWHRGEVEAARVGWAQLAERFRAMGHRRVKSYLDKLERELPPRR